MLVSLALSVNGHTKDQNYSLEIESEAIAGSSGYLSFDLIDASDPADLKGTVSDLNTNGTLLSSTSIGNTTGSLRSGNTVSLDGGAFFSNYLQSVTFGDLTKLSVGVASGASSVTRPPDFSISLLDDNKSPYSTADPRGTNTTVAFRIGEDITPTVFDSQVANASLRSKSNPPQPPDNGAIRSVPFTGTLWVLLSAALAAVAYPAVKTRALGKFTASAYVAGIVALASVSTLHAADVDNTKSAGALSTTRGIPANLSNQSQTSVCKEDKLGTLRIVGLPVGGAIKVYFINDRMAPKGGLTLNVEAENDDVAIAGNASSGLQPKLFIPAGEYYTETKFTIAAKSVGTTKIRAIPAESSADPLEVIISVWALDEKRGTSFFDAARGKRNCLKDAGVTEERSVLGECGQPVKQVAADGLSKLVTRLKAGMPGKVCYRVESEREAPQGEFTTGEAKADEYGNLAMHVGQ